MAVIPEWLNTPNVGALYAQGLSIGAQVAEKNAQLQQEARRMEMESAVRQEQIKRQSAMEQARLATQKAYQTMQIELEQQRLGQAAQGVQLRTQAAAQKLADQQKFAGLIRNNVPMDQALAQVPGLATPSALMAAKRDQTNLVQQRLEIARQNVEMQKKRIAMEQQRIDEAKRHTPSKMIMSLGEMYTALRNTFEDTPEGKEQADAIRELIRQRISGGGSAPAKASGPSPYKEGQTIRDKKTGKVYKVVNGRPVLHEDADNEPD